MKIWTHCGLSDALNTPLERRRSSGRQIHTWRVLRNCAEFSCVVWS